MPPMQSAEFEQMMDDFVREHTRTSGVVRFRREESVSVLIRPVKPIRLVPENDDVFGLDEGLYEETETDETPTVTRPVLVASEDRENAYWKFLSAQMRTVLQSIVGYSELIEEDLLAGELMAPLSDLMRIRSASAELLDMAHQIEELLFLEREKRHVAEKLGALARQLNYAVDRRSIFVSLLSSIASLIAFGEACVLEPNSCQDWDLVTRWGRDEGTDKDPWIKSACLGVARTTQPCVQPLHDGGMVMGFPIRVDGACVAVLLLRGVFDRREQAHHAGVVMAFVEQVEKALHGWRELDEIKNLAMYDGLTGSLNRRTFFDLASGDTSLRSVVMLDIDHFKSINDTYGHGGGDEVLREIVKRIQVTLRDCDIVGRYGGEEFAMVIQVDKPSLAVDIAERVRLAICEEPVELPSGDAIAVSASLGVVTDEGELEHLLGRADELLYLAKSLGRNQVCGEEN